MELIAQRRLSLGGKPIAKGDRFEVQQPFAAGLINSGVAVKPPAQTVAKSTTKPPAKAKAKSSK